MTLHRSLFATVLIAASVAVVSPSMAQSETAPGVSLVLSPNTVQPETAPRGPVVLRGIRKPLPMPPSPRLATSQQLLFIRARGGIAAMSPPASIGAAMTPPDMTAATIPEVSIAVSTGRAMIPPASIGALIARDSRAGAAQGDARSLPGRWHDLSAGERLRRQRQDPSLIEPIELTAA
jgi:hypothetical protein